MELNLDKSTWKPVIFGDVVQEVRTTIKDPKGEGIERVVGLEHIETENIHLSKWASIEEDTTFTKGFKKGHVLFGRRRAYLKKAAQAGFDGICSGDITVMEAKDDLLPELLPFLVCNDKFFDYAVKHSAGGLSPRTKFKDIANYEFLLPPKDQQAKLAELLWAADAMVELQKCLLQECITAKRSYFYSQLHYSSRLPLSEFAEVSYGMGQPPTISDDGIPMIRATNVKRGKISEKNLISVKENEIPKGKNVKLVEGDIIVVRSGAYTGDAAMISERWAGCIAGYDLVVRPNRKSINPVWLCEYLLEDQNQSYFKGESIRSAQPHLNSKQVLNAKIPKLSMVAQTEIAESLSVFYQTEASTIESIGRHRELLKSLINQIF